MINGCSGGISGDETFCTSFDPVEIISTSLSTCTGTLSYHWEQSSDLSSWNIIEKGIKPIWDDRFASTTVCIEICGNGEDDNGNMLTDCDDPACIVSSAGSIAGDEENCGSYNPIEISNTGSAVGEGDIDYQWQTSTDGVLWSNFASATLETFDPPTIPQTTYYRRGAKSEFCNTWRYSNVVEKLVVNNFTNAGQVNGDESECEAYDPDYIAEVSSATGGLGGLTNYQWQSRISGGSWTNITGETDPILNPEPITQTTEYRRGARRAPCTNFVFSNIVTKEVLGAPSAGIATYPTEDLCSNSDYNFTAQNVGSSVIYYWNFGSYASQANATGVGPHSISFDPPKTSASTTIEVELVISSGGCDSRDTVEIEVLAGIDTTSIVISDPSSCCLLYTSPSPRDATLSRMPSSA